MFYAAVNSYASETSVGFANTWSVLGFATRATRDAYVKAATDLATRAITTADFGKYGNAKRGEIDHYDAAGDYHQHCGNGEFVRDGRSIDVATGKQLAREF